MFCVHSAAVLCGREATHLAMSQFIPFMSLPWEIFVLKPSRSWLGFTLGGECSRVQVGGRRRKMGPWWAGTGMPDVPVRNGPKLRAAFLPLPPLSWHHRWQTCKGEGTYFVVTVLEIGRFQIVTFELWPSKRSHPAALTSGEKMLELGRDWRKREKANASAS